MLPNIKPISTIPHSSNHSTVQSSVNIGTANTMPTTRIVGDIKNSNRQENNLHHNFRKQVFSPYLAPSNGSTTESFLKAKSIKSSIYRHNEMSTKYHMISAIPIKLYNMQRKIDLIF